MEIDWKPLRRIFDANQRFMISSHVRPDADAVGSELALASILESMGKSATIVNPSETPPNLAFLDPSNRIKKIGAQISPDEVADTDVHIVLDTSAWVQLQEVGRVLRRTNATKVVIDHHFSADDLGAIEFKDATAEATGALIFRMARALQLPFNARVCANLFCAIATDTGWFRFSSTRADTLRIAADLIDGGAQPNLIYEQLYERFSHSRIRLTGLALARTVLESGGRLAYTWVTLEDFAETNAKPVETEDLVNECLRIAGTEAAFILIEQLNKSVKVSFRSRTSLNVAEVAGQFGGGGHKQAAGAVLPGPLPSARKAVVKAMKAALGES